MREIKFRAWDKKHKKWLEAGQSLLGYLVAWESHTIFEVLGRGDYELVQYTGLKDKNGQEIYEGDILRWQCSKSGSKKVDQYVVTINWDNGRYGLTIHDNGEKWATNKSFWNEKDREVIGNIYEHPHLLEGKA